MHQNQNQKKNKTPVAGKTHTFGGKQTNINLFAYTKKYPGDIHDSSNVPGWNNKV